MKTALPFLWFGLAALELAAAIFLVSSMPAQIETVPALTMYLPNALIGLFAAILTGLVYMLVFRARPSLAAVIFGTVHFAFALTSEIAQIAASRMQGAMIAGAFDPANTATLGILFGAAGLTNLLGLIAGIIAVIIALNTKPPVSADVF